ncbi:glycoside hydrolase family 28 protein [Cuneatibacter caecimuris]|uniref:Glycosyl hydrolase family 28 n=1 Tax=Cuneatibacter caecimuris TaxID=1796618 RepID=A0A4Q7PNG4_9FIRM|nr:glycosyl hydrolase family 28 protein [Cuneatibacter caecimuris]RZT02499.1 glycosyl hydrolase family 28 [Cuneatibacter caecimuris]
MTYDILAYGAAGDGRNNDGPAIQAAIDACARDGGGRVLVPGGRTYKTGSLVLKDYVELHLEMGAVLRASEKKEDYGAFTDMEKLDTAIKVPTYMNCEYAGKPENYFIYAKDAKYVAITGSGKIDGNEEIYYGTVTKWHIDGSYYPRIPLLFFEHVTQLTLTGVTLTGSAFWTTHLVGCEDVLIDGIRILNNLRLANCDGIDPDHCRNVRIANCHIESADDCIVFKNTGSARQYGNCENIVVTNCTLTSTSAAVKFGTESEDTFKNISVSNCVITRTNRGISLQLRDGGAIENCNFSNISIETRRFSKHWWGEGEPVSITAIDRKPGVKAGRIKNIRFQNINCKGENGIFIHGMENNLVEDLYFENVRVELVETTDWPKINHDLRPCEGEGIIPGTLNAVYCRYAKGVKFNNLKIEVHEEVKKFVEQEVDAADTEDFVIA